MVACVCERVWCALLYVHERRRDARAGLGIGVGRGCGCGCERLQVNDLQREGILEGSYCMGSCKRKSTLILVAAGIHVALLILHG